MEATPLKTTHIITKNEDLFTVICETFESNHLIPTERSVLVLAETVVAICQGRVVDLNNIQEISPKAQSYAKEYEMDPRFVEIICQEADTIVGGIPTMLLTEKNHVLIANAGIDHSNSGGRQQYSLWPADPFKVAAELTQNIKKKYHLTEFGIIIADSRVQPVRKGVVGVAIGAAGFEPVIDCRGKCDLFGNEMKYTTRAIADQLTDVAHVVMGECDEQTPFVLIENVPAAFTDRPIDPQAMIMPKKEDLFFRILTK
ncbi:MAG: coenzyme F420-0:L-glutamate ligase [Promethearchaeota archaeon]